MFPGVQGPVQYHRYPSGAVSSVLDHRNRPCFWASPGTVSFLELKLLRSTGGQGIHGHPPWCKVPENPLDWVGLWDPALCESCDLPRLREVQKLLKTPWSASCLRCLRPAANENTRRLNLSAFLRTVVVEWMFDIVLGTHREAGAEQEFFMPFWMSKRMF